MPPPDGSMMHFLIDDGCSRAQLTVGSATHGLMVVLGTITRQAEQVMRKKPVRSLLHNLQFPTQLSLIDCDAAL